MATGLARSREVFGVDQVDQVDQAVRRFEEQWRHGRPDLEQHWHALGGQASLSLLAALVKAELRGRFEKDERPAAAEYLERFPALCDSGDRVLSLVYEEYCLREERNERPDTAEFCARYGPWKDSLESQLRYHRVLSQVVASAPPPPRFPETGEYFLHFLIGKELGRGGAGRVYQARDDSLGGREVALKVSHDRGREPAIMGRLEHPHIVPVHSVVYQERDGTKLRGLCMPYKPGLPLDKVIDRIKPSSRPVGARTLFDAIRDEGPGPTEPAGEGWARFPTRGTYAEGVAWIVAVLAEALEHAHTHEIFHRDVKPANVLLAHREGPQLLDFNLSHDPNSAIEAEAAARGGTLPYMAPEQLEAFLDPKRWETVARPADIYSLGMLMRELLTGQAPMVPDPLPPLPRAIRTLLDQRVAYLPDLRRLNPTVPHALEAIAGRCLAFEPSARYQSAADLAEDLRHFLAHQPLKHATNPSVRERLVNWSARNRSLVGALVLMTALGVAAVSVRANQEGPLPIEARPEFLHAAETLEKGRADEALVELRLLGAEVQALPLPAFYTAVAYTQTGHLREADEELEWVWSRPGADSLLTAWGRSHEPFASMAEVSGRKLLILTSLPSFNQARMPGVYNRLEQTFRLVLRLDPTRDGAQEGLAIIDEGRGQFASAHEVLSKLIASFQKRPETPEVSTLMASALLLRARVSTRWADSLLNLQGGGEPPPDAKSHLTGALADLDRGAAIVGSDGSEMAYDLIFIRCKTLLVLADLDQRQGRLDTEDDFNRQAERLLPAIANPPLGRERAYKNLEKKIRQRIQTANRKPESPDPASTAPRGG